VSSGWRWSVYLNDVTYPTKVKSSVPKLDILYSNLLYRAIGICQRYGAAKVACPLILLTHKVLITNLPQGQSALVHAQSARPLEVRARSAGWEGAPT
jgi:hypothetical protein